jgi:hypothetical protein
MDKAGDLMGEFARQHKIGSVMNATRIVVAANKVSGGAYEAVSFRDGRLKVMVPAGPPLYFLKLKEKETIKRINEALGEEKIKKLVLCGY